MFYALAAVCLVLLVIYLSRRRLHHKNLPPGPTPLPLIGNLTCMKRNNVFLTFRELRAKYGDVFTLHIGNTVTIVFNGYSTLREAFVQHGDSFSDRPDIFIFKDISKHHGIAGSSGELWKEHRTFALATLREFGFGKRSLESKIMEEIEAYLPCLEEKKGEPFNIHALTQTSVSNIICSIVFGQRFDYKDERFTKLMEMFDANFKLMNPIMNFFPFLQHIPGDPFKGKQVLRNAEAVYAFIWELVQEHDGSLDDTCIRDYVDAYLKEKKERQADKCNTFTDVQMLRSIGDLFSAGTETTTTAIRWAILFLLYHPDVKERMVEEIHDVVGTSRFPTLNDKENMPYSEAVITEVIRKANVAPLSVPHSCNTDVEFRGYTIPKGAVLLLNIDSVLFDPEEFPDPDKFDPTRFLNKNEKSCRHEVFAAFSIGRRACLGETLARMELFLYLTTILQRFDLVPEHADCLPSLEGVLGVTHTPRPYNVRLVSRQ
ncbi:cytochrome P450 2B4-like [Pecten maximus]|uniref:cytochrome P450 2B4-like n=1 Tax=Pecten maximus TaxID=6579 RepID=UPI0014585EB6|nr:cytochrome P450 2B4-like [Pecten maximus]